MPSYSATGLAGRRKARLSERALKRRHGLGRTPKSEVRDVWRARLWFATLPVEDLLEAYTAVKAAFDKRKNTTP